MKKIYPESAAPTYTTLNQSHRPQRNGGGDDGEVGREGVTLPKTKGSVKSVEWAPKNFGMKVASILSDIHLRLCEYLESGSNMTNAPTSLNWSLIEDVYIPSLASSSTLQTDSSPAAAAASLFVPTVPAPGQGGSGSGSTSPYMGTSTLVGTGNMPRRWKSRGVWRSAAPLTLRTNARSYISLPPNPPLRTRPWFCSPGSKPHSSTPPRDRECWSYAHPRRSACRTVRGHSPGLGTVVRTVISSDCYGRSGWKGEDIEDEVAGKDEEEESENGDDEGA
ncbi:hypothetical protein BU17DRAFT_61110 [Hysterangium stoloniferum]|nr:hypothetical protein BU17DRAFT_61110 [Hysterangium stoloniferum]